MACVLRQRSNRFPSLHPPSCQCECNTKVDCNKNNKNALQLLLENRNDETCCPLKANVKWHPTNQRNNNNINKSYLFAGHEERKKKQQQQQQSPITGNRNDNFKTEKKLPFRLKMIYRCAIEMSRSETNLSMICVCVSCFLLLAELS